MRSAGPLARSVADGALLMTILSRPDPRDFKALPPRAENYHLKLARDLKGIRLGLMLDMGFGIPVSDEVRQVVEKGAAAFEDAGATLEVIPPVFDFDPNSAIELPNGQTIQVMNLIEKIEDLDDVQNVYSTLEVTDEAIAALETA